MWNVPWGIMLLLPGSVLLFFNKGRWLVRGWGLSPCGLLCFIFLLLLGAFVSFNATAVHLNLGGVVAVVFALRLILRLEPEGYGRVACVWMLVAILCYAFQSGFLWWLIHVPFDTDWLLPLFAGALAALLGLRAAYAAPGLICGLLLGNVAAEATRAGGLGKAEFGGIACLNTMLTALYICLFIMWLKQITVQRQPND
jgi:hypothetical protein